MRNIDTLPMVLRWLLPLMVEANAKVLGEQHQEALKAVDYTTGHIVWRWTFQAMEIAAVLSGERDWCVIEADCLQVLGWLPDKSVSHVITDPPYEAEAHTLQRRVKRESGTVLAMEPLSFTPITESDRTEAALRAALVAERWVLMFCQIEAAPKWRAALEAGGQQYVRTGIWVKPGAQPQLTGDRPGMGYESIMITHRPGRKRWNGGGRSGVFVHCKQDTANGKQAPHPTTKPINLMLELVELFTDPGEVILDAFAGSGTTGVAALRLGRRAILIERDAKYAAIARQRMEAEERGQSLKEYRTGQMTLWG